ncbi:MAG: SDR family NAD(P)-dependent oxidoreductase [Thermodesulfobacteriota bacterium]
MGGLDGRVAVVTGGGSREGIVFAGARSLARDGAAVVLADLCREIDIQGYYRLPTWEDLQASAEELRGAGGQVLAARLDVTDKGSVEEMVSFVLREMGGIDILVNNAGGAPGPGPLHLMEEEAWRRTLEINLHGTFLVSRGVVNQMLAQGRGGAVVNVSSKAGKIPRAFAGAYCVAKAAVIMLTRVQALELAPYGIRVNAVCPAQIDTPLERWSWELEARLLGKEVDQVRQEKISQIPVGRVGTPDDVAEVVRLLVSNRASYMTGQAINITGGQLMVI